MRVLLISANVTLSPYPVYPLGMSMVAAALTRAGHTVRQTDFLVLETDLDAVGREVKQFGPELVGISVRNIDNVNLVHEKYYIDNVKNIVGRVKEVTGAKVLLGGAGFSLVPELILRETGADYGIVGEGELLTVEFADNAARGVYPDRPILGPDAPLCGGEIDAALYDERLVEFYRKSGNIFSIQTKRGCASKCLYCTYPVLEGVALRCRDPRAVVDDIELLRDKFGAKYLFFVDSVFNDDEGRYLKVIDEMLHREVCIPWTAFIKPGGLTDEIVARMKRTGFAAAEVGADAACDTTLSRMAKGFTFSDIVTCNDLFARHGIAISHFFMFGGPGETEATVREGVRNILGLAGCVSFIFMGIRILPDTPLAQLALREKVLAPDDGMLKPVYYLSPALDAGWLQDTLTRAFEGVRHCVFPPDALDDSLRVLHKFGYAGPMWELLLQDKKPRDRGRHAAS